MSLNLQEYQALATLLEQFRADVATKQIDAYQLQQRLTSLRELFGQRIVPLADVDSRTQSYQTEISKQLRLLEVDIMFYQGARQISTAQARLQTISDRLTTLISYCSAILQPENQK